MDHEASSMSPAYWVYVNIIEVYRVCSPYLYGLLRWLYEIMVESCYSIYNNNYALPWIPLLCTLVFMFLKKKDPKDNFATPKAIVAFSITKLVIGACIIILALPSSQYRIYIAEMFNFDFPLAFLIVDILLHLLLYFNFPELYINILDNKIAHGASFLFFFCSYVSSIIWFTAWYKVMFYPIYYFITYLVLFSILSAFN